MLKQILASSSVATLMLLTGLPSYAQEAPAPQAPTPSPDMQAAPQTEVSPEDLQRFASVIQQIQSIQQESQAEAVGVLESEGLSPQQFNAILETQRNPEAQPATDISQDELQSFEQAITQVADIQQQAQVRMQAAVEQEGLDVQRFNQIGAIVREDPALMQQVQQMLQ